MEFIFEILFQFLAEMVIQVIGELLVDCGLRSLKKGRTARRDPVLGFLGSVVLGVFAGLAPRGHQRHEHPIRVRGPLRFLPVVPAGDDRPPHQQFHAEGEHQASSPASAAAISMLFFTSETRSADGVRMTSSRWTGSFAFCTAARASL